MIGSILKIGSFIFDKFKAKGPTPEKYVMMKRALLAVVLFLLMWGLIHPESLFYRIERMMVIMPDWMAAALSMLFAGIVL